LEEPSSSGVARWDFSTIPPGSLQNPVAEQDDSHAKNEDRAPAQNIRPTSGAGFPPFMEETLTMKTMLPSTAKPP